MVCYSCSRNAKNRWKILVWCYHHQYGCSNIYCCFYSYFFFFHSLALLFVFSHNRWHKKKPNGCCYSSWWQNTLPSDIKNLQEDSWTYTSNYQRHENDERERERKHLYVCGEYLIELKTHARSEKQTKFLWFFFFCFKWNIGGTKEKHCLIR